MLLYYVHVECTKEEPAYAMAGCNNIMHNVVYYLPTTVAEHIHVCIMYMKLWTAAIEKNSYYFFYSELIIFASKVSCKGGLRECGRGTMSVPPRWRHCPRKGKLIDGKQILLVCVSV